MRFGIEMNTDHTLEQVGKQFGMLLADASARSEPRRASCATRPARERLRSFLDTDDSVQRGQSKPS